MNSSITLAGPFGTSHTLIIHRYGRPGARPQAYIQAGLHADEVPGMLTAQHFCARLAAVPAEQFVGEVIVVPVANPIGLGQRVLGSAIGRFDLSDGLNFNRGYPVLRPSVTTGTDATANVTLIRAALHAAHDATPRITPAEHLKHALLAMALDADIVLDLHCDGEATMHLYALTPSAPQAAALAGFLGANPVLLAEESGDNPFDEAASRPWLDLAHQHPDAAIPQACFACTVELRGAGDVSDAMAEADSAGLLAFLRHQGVLTGGTQAPPAAAATPLAGVEHLIAPVPGVVVFHVAPGAEVAAGTAMLDIVDPATGARITLTAQHDGIFFARGTTRFAAAGRRLGKIAGAVAFREGKLLTP